MREGEREFAIFINGTDYESLNIYNLNQKKNYRTDTSSKNNRKLRMI